MATSPLPEAAESRYALYIDELREFFATSGVPFGLPENIFALAGRLQGPGNFSDDLSSLIRSIVLRQGGAMPHAELLEILSLAIAGPQLAAAPQQFREPLRQLLGFVSGVMRRPWNVPPTESESAEVVPFPTDARTSEPPAHPPGAVFEPILGAQIREQQIHEEHSRKQQDKQVRESPYEPPPRAVALPVSHLPEPASDVPMQPAKAVPESDATPPRRWTPMRRNLLLGVAGAISLAAVLILVLRPHPPEEIFHVGPAPTHATGPLPSAATTRPQAAAPNPAPPPAVEPVVTGPLPESVPAKSSPYSETAQPHLNRRPKPAISAWAYTPPPQPAFRPQSAGNPQPDASASSFPSPGNPPSSAAPEVSGVHAAPIIRRPAYTDPDSSIVGDLPIGQTHSFASAATPHFTVSSGVMAAYLIFSPDPDYPALARIAHIHGEVILQAVVAKDGSVSSVRVLRGNRLLRGAAADAVRHWRYRPYRLAGQPIDVATIVTLDFDDRN